jgi:bifunctional DNA-binding transcriptional regulator/antitoxin component of YhaV-PrlF toxin-antitoxin module
MEIVKSKVDQAGRILVPSAYRHLLHLMPGQDIILHVEKGELRIRSFQESAKRARDLVKQYNSKNQDLVELLFQARKEDKSRG